MRDLKAANQNAKAKTKTKVNRRKRQKQKRDWKRIFHRLLVISVRLGSLVLLVSGGFLVGQMLFDSGYFRVDSVRILNNQRVSQNEILGLSDIRQGNRMFDLDLELIGAKIEENPWIVSAQVKRVFPRQVLVQVTEREPQAIINLGYLYYVDGGGEIFKQLDSGDSLDFPVITGIDRNLLLEQPEQTRNQLVLAMSLIEVLGSRRVFTLGKVSELKVDVQEGLVLYTYTGGVPVRMGYENFAAKLDRLETIYPELEPRLLGLKSIDLNVIDRVIVQIDSQFMNRKS